MCAFVFVYLLFVISIFLNGRGDHLKTLNCCYILIKNADTFVCKFAFFNYSIVYCYISRTSFSQCSVGVPVIKGKIINLNNVKGNKNHLNLMGINCNCYF